MVYIGIDPGASGGIAAIVGGLVRAQVMPATKRDILDVLREAQALDVTAHAVLERVWSSPGWGHVGAFKFGGSFHSLEMALLACNIPYDLVLPRRWQAEMGVSYPAGRPRDKNITKRRAQALFPFRRITHGVADALLLAEYCRRVHLTANHTRIYGQEKNVRPDTDQETGSEAHAPTSRPRQRRKTR